MPHHSEVVHDFGHSTCLFYLIVGIPMFKERGQQTLRAGARRNETNGGETNKGGPQWISDLAKETDLAKRLLF